MAFQVADLFEVVVDTVAEVDRGRVALVDDEGTRLTYPELDAAANRFAHALDAAGIGAGDRIGLALHNSVGHVVAIIGAYKRRAVPVNVNFRYTARELDHVAEQGELRMLLHDRDDELVASVRAMAHAPKLTLPLDELALDGMPATRAFGPRADSDECVIFTGGTTGLPKGVVWRQDDLFFSALGGGNPGGPPITAPEALGAAVLANPAQRITPFLAMHPGHPGLGPRGFVTLSLGPLVHAGGMWGSIGTLLGGGTLVINTRRHMDLHHVLDLVAREEIVMLTLVGDASARPLLRALEERPDHDPSTLLLIGSGAAILSGDVKAALLRAVPSVLAVLEAIGSSEYPSQAVSVVTRAALDGDAPPPSLTFAPKPETLILDDDLQPIPPGSGRSGRLATTGRLPLGYLGDPDRTASTIVELDGKRFILPGDYAIADADGTIHLLGRGSLCINTGGEKVYPEEVEAELLQHPAIADALVVGVDDEQYGQRVAAVIALADGAVEAPTLEELQRHARTALAGYKLPRALTIVDAIPRSPAGKGDYTWAKAQASRRSQPA